METNYFIYFIATLAFLNYSVLMYIQTEHILLTFNMNSTHYTKKVQKVNSRSNN
jgi:hypothetical protein